jgi:hypothetical protein
MACGLVASLVALRVLQVAWTWNVAVGALVTFAVGWTVSVLRAPAAAPPRSS